MPRRVLDTAALCLVAVAFRAPRANLVDAWYPIAHAGNMWTYEEESRDADPGHGISNPTIGRWTTTETVSAVDVIPEGTRVTIRAEVSNLVRLHGWHQNPSLMTATKTELLVRGRCVYRLTQTAVSYPDDIWSAYDADHRLRPEFRNALLHGVEPAAFCFPLASGGEWGRVPSTAPDEEDVWKVKSLNGDPFGLPGARTFHVYGQQGSGETTDYWFQQGVGIVQFVEEHHGTYDEYRRRLIRSTVDAVTTDYDLRPARTPALFRGECRAGWRRWITAEGRLLPNLQTCEAYAPPDPILVR